ncbi:MAG TPA: KpsF/GutQ family sugar-phosphate isomerase [Vicinamibacterales bacterium]|jgi:arabinose-5-phosphate isomerase
MTIDLEPARKVLQAEAAAILELVSALDGDFQRAVRLLLDCRGRVIVTGIGKSGIICQKIAATFSSTGTASYFLHPVEALHGDLGVIQSDDVVLAISYSGETEVVRLIEPIKRLGARLIAITGDCHSTLAQRADVVIHTRISDDASPLNLVPTASAITALALGDALAMTLLVAKGFQLDDFLHLHPGGHLPKKFRRVEQLMTAAEQAPVVPLTTPVPDVIREISSKKLGMTCVVDENSALVGVITDGDLRRHLISGPGLLTRSAGDIMTRHPITIRRGTLAAEALNILERHKITSLVVVDEAKTVQGVVHLHDLWRTEMV